MNEEVSGLDQKAKKTIYMFFCSLREPSDDFVRRFREHLEKEFELTCTDMVSDMTYLGSIDGLISLVIGNVAPLDDSSHYSIAFSSTDRFRWDIPMKQCSRRGRFLGQLLVICRLPESSASVALLKSRKQHRRSLLSLRIRKLRIVTVNSPQSLFLWAGNVHLSRRGIAAPPEK